MNNFQRNGAISNTAVGSTSQAKASGSVTASQNKESFDVWMQNRQVEWRNNPANGVCREQGWQNKRQYPWILPSDKWEEGLWSGIRSSTSNSLPAYLGTEIQAHQGKHNLKSSWMLCANLYFPFGATVEGRALLASFLRHHVSDSIASVDELHLEYAEEGPLSPSNLLGEIGGKRGSGQTSPDLAFHVNGRRGLILIESKMTEHSFYPCSARRTSGSDERPGNPDPARCKNLKALLSDVSGQCHQCAWGRKYWNILRPVVNEDAICALKCCPAARAGYQLFRQHALAEGMANSGKYDTVCSCVALDGRNTVLLDCLTSTGITALESGWGSLFKKEAKTRFRVFSHQAWVAWVGEHGASSQWGQWLDYVTERYGFTRT